MWRAAAGRIVGGGLLKRGIPLPGENINIFSSSLYTLADFFCFFVNLVLKHYILCIFCVFVHTILHKTVKPEILTVQENQHCTLHTAPAPTHVPVPEPILFLLLTEHWTLHITCVYCMLDIYHFTLHTTKSCLSWYSRCEQRNKHWFKEHHT